MAGRSYERLDIETFGKHLLSTGDLDPIYVALLNMEDSGWCEEALKRWLVAYWCFYHAGVACYLSELEGKTFWDAMMTAAENTRLAPTEGRWPRGSERRHFRGQAAMKAVNKLRTDFNKPEHIISVLVGEEGDRSFASITARSKQLPLFGPWIAFKIADMVDRVLGLPVVGFDQAAVFMFADPTKAALRLWALKAGLSENARPKDEAKAIQQVVDYLTHYFSSFQAPPRGDRPVGLQEVETVLCKWKSHMNGHYPLYNDIDEINEGLHSWRTVNSTADLFARCMPPTNKAE